MNPDWTGGQYSLYRIVFGSYLFVHFAQLAPWGRELFSRDGMLPDGSESPLLFFPNVLAVWDTPLAVVVLFVGALILSVIFTIGSDDRIAAVLLWYLLACLFGRNPLIGNPSLPFIGWLLLAHACIPGAPYGSWAARGRTDPSGSWKLPPVIHGTAWALMALGYSYSGYTKLVSPSWVDGTALTRVLENPLARPGLARDLLLSMPDFVLILATWGSLGLELIFAPLALLRRVRPWLWTTMLVMHLSLIVVIDFADLSLGMVVLHLFTFNPSWIKPLAASAGEILFYDGACGLCHRAVRFILAEDPAGTAFRFAPLDGETFRARVPVPQRQQLPDSMVLLTASGELLTRSAAVLHMLRRLGGAWRCLGAVAALVPRFLRDRIYDAIAAVRHRMFRRPEQACPILPPELRERFET